MSPRRRLNAAERWVVDPVVSETLAEIEDELLVAALERVLLDHLAALPRDLRDEALVRTMNELGQQIFTGVRVGLGIATTGGESDG